MESSPAYSYGKLTITIESAKSVRKLDTFSANDPYVQFKVPGNEQFTTKVLENAGMNPVWGENLTVDVTEENYT